MFAEEDKRRKEELDVRNNADQMVYQTEKLISENGDKLSDDDKAKINSATDALKEALKGQDINLVKSRQDELTKIFYEISEQLYKAANPNGDPNAQGFDPNAQGGFGGQNGEGGDGYYDANYTDVN